VVVGFVLAALLVRTALGPLLDERAPYLFFMVASLAAVWFAGGAAGFIVLVIGGCLAQSVFVSHSGPWYPLTVKEWTLFGTYLLSTSAGILIMMALRRALFRAEQAGLLAQRRGEQLRAGMRKRTEAEARWRELAAVVESAQDAIVTTNLHLQVKSWNAAAEKLLGRKASAMLGQSLLGLIPEPQQDSVREKLEQLRRGEPVALVQTLALGNDEQALELSISLSPLRNQAGDITGVSSIMRDLGPVRRAERALQASEQRFRVMADAAPVMMWIADTEKQCTWVNKAWLDFTGRPVESELGHGWFANIHEDDREAVMAALQTAFDHRVKCEIEYRFRRDDGQYRWIFERGIPHLAPDGAFLGYIGTCLDVTERKQAEEALQQKFDELRTAQQALRKQNEQLALSQQALEAERSRYRELFDSAPVGYIISTPQGVIQQANAAAAALLNESLEFLSGFPMVRLLAKEDRPTFFAHIGRLTRQVVEKVENWEVVLQPHQRVAFSCAITVNLVRDEMGKPSGLRWLMRDISERKQAEQKVLRLNTELEQRVRDRTAELQKANQELEAFSYSVSHDLRAPLRSIAGFSKAVLEEYRDKLDKQAVTYLQHANDASKRMSQLIEDLLAFSRYTRCEMRRQHVDLSALAEGIVTDLLRSDPKRNVEVKIAPGIQVDGDEALLRIAMQNLLDNAWKFTGKKPNARIELGIAEKNGGSAYFVQDNGAGFSMEHARRLFGVFQRLHSTEEFPGTGVGLATVRRIFHRHGGDIWAESEVDKGATFYFTVPGEQSKAGARAVPLAEATVPPPMNSGANSQQPMVPFAGSAR
jgi:PAS domain S-box-containing protein